MYIPQTVIYQLSFYTVIYGYFLHWFSLSFTGDHLRLSFTGSLFRRLLTGTHLSCSFPLSEISSDCHIAVICSDCQLHVRSSDCDLAVISSDSTLRYLPSLMQSVIFTGNYLGSRSGLTMPLSRHCVRTYRETSSHATRQGTLGHCRLSSLSHCGLTLA